jgi:hypothetical protein
MSAFIVSSDCINSIVTYVHIHIGEFSWLMEGLRFNVSTEKGLEELASALYRMNCDAIEQRYGKKALQSDLSAGERFNFRIVRRQPVEVFKAVRCLLYQCSEGNVPERELFKTLEEIGGQIAQEIVRELPDFEKAAWGD